MAVNGSAPALSEAELSNFTTAFYSEIGDGTLTTEKLQQLANAIVAPGAVPYDKIEAIVDALQPSKPNQQFDFPKMLRMLADAIRPQDELNRDGLINALKAFDQDPETGFKRTGYIPTGRIKEILQTYPGAGISARNLDDVVERCDPKKVGKVKVEELADLLLS